ncbi:sensor histidine kinase [Actinoplanes sp. TFC3]|uniref:sensor histidine kinase n=1 Tax=Actinoplanes sp. TFC3 TaxID=1710355 RepID=UPI00082C2427|nr:ATP-binding protein [Actinoplanes sp. TFC3]
MLVAAFVVVVFWLPPALRSDSRAAGLLLAGVAAAAMALRRRHPSQATLVAGAVTLLGTVFQLTEDPMLATAWCLYPLAVHQASRVRHPAVWLPILVAGVAVVSAVPSHGLGQRALVSVIALTAAGLLGTVVGRQIEAERAQVQLAVARDVHDVVGRALGTITAEAGVVAALPDAEEKELRETLAGIETHARGALGQIQTLVRTLRAPRPATPLSARVALPAGTGTTAYWIVQEALTNVVRHAPGAACQVDVHDENGSTVIVVRDHGPGATRLGDGGFGLRGMRERVELAGGTVSWGNHPDGGFEVRARLP